MLNKYVSPIFISIGIITISSIIYSLATSFLLMDIIDFELSTSYFIYIVAFMPVGFIIIPHLLAKFKSLYGSDSTVTFSFKSYFCLAVSIFILNTLFIKSDEYFIQMIISMCEEFLFRFVIYKILRSNFTKPQSIIVSSLLFGFILHLEYPLVDNLLIRTPLGILFGILATTFGLEYAIAGHWIYNLFATLI